MEKNAYLKRSLRSSRENRVQHLPPLLFASRRQNGLEAVHNLKLITEFLYEIRFDQVSEEILFLSSSSYIEIKNYETCNTPLDFPILKISTL